ncbi:glycosyl transferase family 2 [Clostridium botulinum]|uniref:glycosyltransferase family 2 protein n=1 Tax=Clostridium botulinum TaxID=1491 RepID=UPI0013CA4CA5|nr:glycosyltransferase family 2 protein [Clostridium botulinum]MBN1059838.1 glycosyl transferase family 2 [Clostridium botulinum]MBN1062984.1 glycosyl transferase family 2 [Clostridium botulinum]NFO10199.1 glycosyl transferase family 2 [Clostridium botulinum]HBJ2621741.1 glycosyltransferase family 2 protein [Clostridium botulinum]
MINIVIPMAGRGSRFANAGYELPKPLIDVHGRHMIEYVVKNVRPNMEHRFIFICLQEHLEKYDLENKLNDIAPGCVIVPVDHVTEGATCTVLLAEKYVDNKDAMMIANSDQFVDIDINEYLASIKEYDGLIMTMTADDPKWSFIKYDKDNFVTLLREKEVISNEATVGIYNYKHGSDFVKYAKQMIEKDIRVNNEYYVAPVYNEMIEDDKKIVYYNIGSEDNGMYGLGIPDDLNKFLKNPISKKTFRR